MIRGVMATWVTPTKSRTGSNARFLLRCPITVCPFEDSMSVWPSAPALATLAVPASPGRFSTSTSLLQRCCSFSATTRARTSVMLPAEKGTTRRTICSGYLAASWAPASATMATVAARTTRALATLRIRASLLISPSTAVIARSRQSRGLVEPRDPSEGHDSRPTGHATRWRAPLKSIRSDTLSKEAGLPSWPISSRVASGSRQRHRGT